VPVTGLSNDSFQIFEDGIEQKISYFASQDAPITLGILFDASRSMEHKLHTSRAAISRFLLTAVPQDEFFLIEFNNQPSLLCDFTQQTAEIEQALPTIRADGWTSLFDAIHLGISRMRHAQNARKALLILSDGGDNNSRYNEREIRSLVREADILIYAIGMLGPGLSRRNVKLLSELAEETGGRYHSAERLEDLPTAIQKISAAIRNQYLVGYLPSNSLPDGRYRKVQLQLNQPAGAPPLRASWRAGYYARDAR
jgi:Ca-activated chloride channel family protein